MRFSATASGPAGRRQTQQCLAILGAIFALINNGTVNGRSLDSSTILDAHAAAAHSSDAGIHIVVSVYRENVDEIKQYITEVLEVPSVKRAHPRVFVYVKGGADHAAAIKASGFAHEIIEAPNVGREGETYLRHVVAYYDKLPAHVFFTQALPQYEGSTERLAQYFGPKTGVLGLSRVSSCTCEGFSGYWPGEKATHGGFIRLRELWALYQGTLCPMEFPCSHNGLIVASRERILAAPKKMHEYVQSLFSITRDHGLRHNEKLYHNLDYDDSPAESGWYTMGHVMERSWMFMFNCTDPMVAQKCESECPGGDCSSVPYCQCLDP